MGNVWSGLSRFIKLMGADDVTPIGNVGDRLKVDVAMSSMTTTVPSWSKKLRYEDMNVLNGGVARGTNIATSANWTTTYTYSGSGYMAGFIINLETFTGWEIRLVIDGEVIFSFVDNDLAADTIYDVDDVTDQNQSALGISKGSHDRFVWHSPLSSPLYFAATGVVQIRRPTAGAKKFQAGLMVISKET